MSTDTTQIPVPEITETVEAPSKAKASKPSKTPKIVENARLPVTSIKIPDQWNREGPGKLDSLVASLKLHGQVVAITVRPGNVSGEYELVDGRRRLLAMQEAGIKEAIAIVVDSADSTDAYVKSFVANFQRLNHDPVEISNVFAVLSETMKNKEIAVQFGVSEGYVSQHLTIRKLPAKFLAALKKGSLLMGEARELCRLDVEEDATKLDEIGTQLLEATLDAFQAAEKISLYLERKDEKAAEKEGKGKKGKAKSKGKDKDEDGKESKQQGRPVKVKDYSESKSIMKMISKDRALEILTTLSEKITRTKSEKNREYLKGRIDQAEEDCGLRDAD